MRMMVSIIMQYSCIIIHFLSRYSKRHNSVKVLCHFANMSWKVKLIFNPVYLNYPCIFFSITKWLKKILRANIEFLSVVLDS